MHGTGIFYYSGMAYLEIYRLKGKVFSHYEAQLFDDQGFQYKWQSSIYWWLWSARMQAPKAAKAYLNRGPGQHGETFPQGVWIETITL